LGLQPIWTRFGRHVVGNLSTVTNSLRDFTVLLLGYFFVERVTQSHPGSSPLEIFLKWEQLAGYARAEFNKDRSFRGTERVHRNLAEGDRITISASPAYQILGDQKNYGLWGLYTVPSRASSLLEGEQPCLSPPAREFVEKVYLPIMKREGFPGGDKIAGMLAAPESRIDIRGKGNQLVAGVAKLLSLRLHQQEREFYRFHLLHGGPQDATAGLQQQLAGRIESTIEDRGFSWSQPAVVALAKGAAKSGYELLSGRLSRIATCESLIAPLSDLFRYLLGCNGQTDAEIALRIRETWGAQVRVIRPEAIQEILAELGGGSEAAVARWLDIATAMTQGDYRRLVGLLLDQNRDVMSARGGSPWIEKKGNRLNVRFKDEWGSLPNASELRTIWRFSYFLPSLRDIALQVHEGGR
jgi:hypothetical protein